MAIPSFGQSPDYHLQSEDVLQITVYEQPDLDTRARIAANGEIAFPLLGKVQAAGLTVAQLRDKIEELLRKEFPFVNTLYLEEIFMKLESMNIINVFRVSKTKKMIVLNKHNEMISDKLMEELH